MLFRKIDTTPPVNNTDPEMWDAITHNISEAIHPQRFAPTILQSSVASLSKSLFFLRANSDEEKILTRLPSISRAENIDNVGLHLHAQTVLSLIAQLQHLDDTTQTYGKALQAHNLLSQQFPTTPHAYPGNSATGTLGPITPEILSQTVSDEEIAVLLEKIDEAFSFLDPEPQNYRPSSLLRTNKPYQAIRYSSLSSSSHLKEVYKKNYDTTQAWVNEAREYFDNKPKITVALFHVTPPAFNDSTLSEHYTSIIGNLQTIGRIETPPNEVTLTIEEKHKVQAITETYLPEALQNHAQLNKLSPQSLITYEIELITIFETINHTLTQIIASHTSKAVSDAENYIKLTTNLLKDTHE